MLLVFYASMKMWSALELRQGHKKPVERDIKLVKSNPLLKTPLLYNKAMRKDNYAILNFSRSINFYAYQNTVRTFFQNFIKLYDIRKRNVSSRFQYLGE